MSPTDEAIERLRAVDPSGQLRDVNDLPLQLRDALSRCDSARLQPADGAAAVVVCGMGGSAIGGDFAAAVIGDRLRLPLSVIRGYSVPDWVPGSALALCSSYSGNTEETVACYRALGERGARRVVATKGGTLGELAREDGVPVIPLPGVLQPRAAVAYMFAAAAEVAALGGAGPLLREEIGEAADHLEASRDELGKRAVELAERLWGTAPVVYGAELTAPVAYRWKTQVNEYSKLPCFSHELPEADHNEIVGWEGAGGDLGKHSAVFLLDRDQHPRNRQRAELTAELIAARGHRVETLEAEGESRTARLFWTVMLGDLVSLHLAALNGVDPAPVAVIEELKDRLGRP